MQMNQFITYSLAFFCNFFGGRLWPFWSLHVAILDVMWPLRSWLYHNLCNKYVDLYNCLLTCLHTVLLPNLLSHCDSEWSIACCRYKAVHSSTSQSHLFHQVSTRHQILTLALMLLSSWQHLVSQPSKVLDFVVGIQMVWFRVAWKLFMLDWIYHGGLLLF